MRINQFVARTSGLSRRTSDELVASGRVSVNGLTASTGQQVSGDDNIKLDGQLLEPVRVMTIILNKPIGYVCSRKGQGANTIYDILPEKYHSLKPVGRLDKDSSGLLLLTNDGDLAQKLSHPKYQKEKVYKVELDKSLAGGDKAKIERGIRVEDYISKLQIGGEDKIWTVSMRQGKNRQIRRTFAALGYEIIKLHRTKFGDYSLGSLAQGNYRQV